MDWDMNDVVPIALFGIFFAICTYLRIAYRNEKDTQKKSEESTTFYEEWDTPDSLERNANPMFRNEISNIWHEQD